MHIVHSPSELDGVLNGWRADGDTLALVPTMGNLHAGHLSLVQAAAHRCDRVVASIFVNPTQFGQGEDYAEYPRTLDGDAQQLASAAVDLLYAPSVSDLYPHGIEGLTQVQVPALSSILCGASRAGHFTGVATVVNKLFNMVRPDAAFFGEKDFQQLLVIRRMVRDLNMPVDIVGVPTLREADGLAMSSRNQYLTGEERQQAALINQTLMWVKEQLVQGEWPQEAVERKAGLRLSQAGFELDYLQVRRQLDLAEPDESDRELVVLAAASLGRTRLIDNLCFVRR